jgi:hypothetical protein
MKLSFYFKTQEEYERASTIVSEANTFLKAKQHWKSDVNVIRLSSRHGNRKTRNQMSWLTNIPKSKPTDKKYIGVIHANKHLLDGQNIKLQESLEKLKIELVPTLPNPQKYTGEQTRKKFVLTGLSQFRVLTSIFNKRYGHGNWKIRGPKHLQKILKNYEETVEKQKNPNVMTFTTDYYSDKYPDGIPVTLVVNEPDANIEKQLFKMKLKV